MTNRCQFPKRWPDRLHLWRIHSPLDGNGLVSANLCRRCNRQPKGAAKFINYRLLGGAPGFWSLYQAGGFYTFRGGISRPRKLAFQGLGIPRRTGVSLGFVGSHSDLKVLFNAGTEMETNEMTSSQRPGTLKVPRGLRVPTAGTSTQVQESVANGAARAG